MGTLGDPENVAERQGPTERIPSQKYYGRIRKGLLLWLAPMLIISALFLATIVWYSLI